MEKSDIFFICDFETTGLDSETDYPIELGGIFTDSEFNIITTFNALITPPKDECFIELSAKGTPLGHKIYTWREKYLPAYNVHRIDAQELVTSGLPPSECVSKLLKVISNIRRKNGRIIIVSDNAQFEYSFMKRLFKLAGREDEFPFHYSAWNTNLVLEVFAPDIGDAVPVHRALQDAFRLYRQLVRYAERVGFFKS